MGIIGYILGLYRDNGKENGNMFSLRACVVVYMLGNAFNIRGSHRVLRLAVWKDNMRKPPYG